MQSPIEMMPEDETVIEAPAPQRRRGGKTLLFGGLFLIIVAAGLSIPALPTLTGMLFPPMPPLPPEVNAVSHETERTGREHWVYSTASDSCALLDFYIDAGAICTARPGVCPEISLEPLNDEDSTIVFRCEGTTTFADFASRWDAFYRSHGALEVRRIINWFSNEPPQPFPTDNPLAR